MVPSNAVKAIVLARRSGQQTLVNHIASDGNPITSTGRPSPPKPQENVSSSAPPKASQHIRHAEAGHAGGKGDPIVAERPSPRSPAKATS